MKLDEDCVTCLFECHNEAGKDWLTKRLGRLKRLSGKWASGEYTSAVHESSHSRMLLASELEVGKVWISPRARFPKWNTTRCGLDKHTTFCAHRLLTRGADSVSGDHLINSRRFRQVSNSFSFPPSHLEKKFVVVGLGQQLLSERMYFLKRQAFGEH